MTKELTVRKAIVINAQPEEVWRALTDAGLSQKYMFGCSVLSDWKTGSTIEYISTKDGKEVVKVKGIIQNCIPKKLLQYTCFDPASSYRDIRENYTIVTWELVAETDGVTTVRVTQGDFTAAENGENRYTECETGWDYTLNALKAMLEQPIAKVPVEF